MCVRHYLLLLCSLHPSGYWFAMLIAAHVVDLRGCFLMPVFRKIAVHPGMILHYEIAM
jgi:hypothetical protein